MDLGRQIFAKLQRRKKSPITKPLILQGLEVHFYLPDTHQLIYLKGRLSAEELCIEAAKKLGLSPLCSSLFGLYDETEMIWFPPNYIFTIDEKTRLKLHYRMRYYFINWHGTNPDNLPILRHTHKQTNVKCTAILDAASLDYLYAQSQCDFQRGLAPLRSPQTQDDAQLIENECLGMAVMAISHEAMDKNLPKVELVRKFKYKNYIPTTLNQTISQRNFLIRLRIANVFKAFLEEFNERTIKSSSINKHDLKVKYISTLEALTDHFGCEVFEPSSLRIHEDDELCPRSAAESGRARNLVLVSGVHGIKWQKVPAEDWPKPWRVQSKKSKKGKGHNQQSMSSTDATKDNDWTIFSDFHEITHIVIKESLVTVYRQDNKKMELQLADHGEALSFVSLIDGYFRLTVDAHHFLCTDVAPMSVETNLHEGCHGPISTEYAIQKLKKEGYEDGMYLLRWSSADHDHILLTVICTERDVSGGTVKTFKNFQIEKTESGYQLCGTDIKMPTLRELTDQLSGRCLSTDSTSLMLTRGCPPQPRELSNLLMVTRPDLVAPPSWTSQLVFHRINKGDIVQGEHMGKGTHTNIYSGWLKLTNTDDDGLLGTQHTEEVKVVLKVLGAGNKDISAFLETISLMRQISHKHMAVLHGICMHSMDVIMVEEFVLHGPLDLFMRAHHSELTPSWKFQVADQLASVLSYLEDKKLVHGYVCTKNILLAKHGLNGQGIPFIKLSDPGVPITALNREECIGRIPWIAPECVKNPKVLGVAVDKWAFGTTLWEICYNGEAPLRDKKLTEKERFYEAEGALVIPNSSELANLITQCMNYDPRKRPFFRAIVRELDRIKEQNPAMVSCAIPVQEVDPSLFESRFLRTLSKLGEGHFGKVELCVYDPHGDHTGQMVAVKSLKAENDGSQNSNLMREISTMRELYHQNIVKYKGICIEEGGRTIKLIMEYLPAGSLKDYLPKYKAQTSQHRLLLYALQICQGMDYLGMQNYIHRDLAARNVLVKSETLVKIGDFGLTKSIKENEDYYTVKEDQDSPVYWYAPECLIHRKFYKASDVWSFGVTLYELMTYCDHHHSPPEMCLNMIGRSHGQMTMARLVKALEGGWRLSCPKACPDMVYTQMRRCWAHAPEDRVDFKGLIAVFERLLSEEELNSVRSC